MIAIDFFEAIEREEFCRDASLPVSEIVNKNHYWFGLTEEQFLSLDYEVLASTIERGFRLLEEKCGDKPYTVYAWYEDISGRFRISSAPCIIERLPFTCEVRETGSLSEIAIFMWNSHSDTFRETELLSDKLFYPIEVFVVREE